MKHFTQEQKEKLVSQIQTSMKEGLSMKDASKKAGVTDTSFRRWSKKQAARGNRKEQSKPQMITMQYDNPHEDRITIITGQTDKVISALQYLREITRS